MNTAEPAQPTRWMIYGANGYTGELIAREAARRGLKPVLAGRRRESVEALARTLGLEARAFVPSAFFANNKGHFPLLVEMDGIFVNKALLDS